MFIRVEDSHTEDCHWTIDKHSMDSANLHKNLADRLRTAISETELYLDFQPQINSTTGKIPVVEALIRWSPRGTTKIISPIEFIPFAEETGLICPIGAWVLKEACLQNMRWQKEGNQIRVAVNVSAVQVLSVDFITIIEEVLEETGINPNLLELEITESRLLDDLNKTNNLLKLLRKKGITIALDDFGTKYSSMEYLRALEIDKIKIDRRFIQDINTNEKDLNLVRSLVNMSNILGIDCLAEGVETHRQAALLERSGCNMMQGFLFFRPQRDFPVWNHLTSLACC